MRTRALWGAAFLVLLAAGGCSSDLGPTPAERRASWEAQNVYPEGYKQGLLAFMRTYLNDPSHVRGAGVSQPALKHIGPGDRYVACVRYNARDSDGQYQGTKEGAAVFVSGKLTTMLDGKQAAGFCREAAYAPFPELARLTR